MLSQSNSSHPRQVLAEDATHSGGDDNTFLKGPLERNNELVRVLIKKRKLENYLDVCLGNENSEMYVDVGTAETACDYEFDFPFSSVKKVKKELFIEASKEVCTELETQTRKRLSLEEQILELQERVGRLEKQVEQIPGLNKQVEDLKEQVKQIPVLRERVSELVKESNGSMAKRILRGIEYKYIDPLYDDEAATAFKYNVTLLSTGRTDIQPSEFKMFNKFRQCFPYNVNFINYYEAKTGPTTQPSDLEYVEWLCSLFKRFSTETQTSQN